MTTLLDLLEVASAAYPDGLGDLFNPNTGEPAPNIFASSDTLASFVVLELQDAFDEAEDAGTDHYMEARHKIETAIGELMAVRDALYKVEGGPSDSPMDGCRPVCADCGKLVFDVPQLECGYCDQAVHKDCAKAHGLECVNG